MKSVKKIIRLFVIALAGVPFIWFGLRYGRPARPAYGEIFRELSAPLLLQNRDLPAGPVGTPWRFSRVNNNLMYYKVSKGEASIRGLFDSLERSLITAEPSQLASQLAEVGDGGKRGDLGRSSKAIPVFRHEWGNWGAMGFVIGGSRADQGSKRPQKAKAPEKVVPSEISPVGVLIAFIAFLNREEGSTTYLTFLLDASFDYRSLLPGGGSDAPGRDAPGIPRYPGLKRSYTFEERGDAFESVMVVYTGRGNFHEIANFYRSQMVGLGWEQKELPEGGRKGKKLEEVLFFIQKGRECIVYVGGTAEMGLVQTIVSLREARTKG